MAHIPDMELLAGGWTAVGWLDGAHPFPRGKVSPELLARLKEFARLWPQCVGPLRLGLRGGFHECPFCPDFSATGEVGVPAPERLFFAPVMIAHYVERHGYVPPPPFTAAVLTAPLPGTPEYAAAVMPFVR